MTDQQLLERALNLSLIATGQFVVFFLAIIFAASFLKAAYIPPLVVLNALLLASFPKFFVSAIIDPPCVGFICLPSPTDHAHDGMGIRHELCVGD